MSTSNQWCQLRTRSVCEKPPPLLVQTIACIQKRKNSNRKNHIVFYGCDNLILRCRQNYLSSSDPTNVLGHLNLICYALPRFLRKAVHPNNGKHFQSPSLNPNPESVSIGAAIISFWAAIGNYSGNSIVQFQLSSLRFRTSISVFANSLFIVRFQNQGFLRFLKYDWINFFFFSHSLLNSLKKG